MIILGIDPGTATTGFGLVEHKNNQLKHLTHGVISTKPSKTKAERLLEIYTDISLLIKKYKPDYCNIEKLFFQKNTTTAMAVAESRGVILLALQENKIPFLEVTPLELKKNVCGDGKADKKQIQKMVKIILRLSDLPKPDDAADALALAAYSGHKLLSL